MEAVDNGSDSFVVGGVQIGIVESVGPVVGSIVDEELDSVVGSSIEIVSSVDACASTKGKAIDKMNKALIKNWMVNAILTKVDLERVNSGKILRFAFNNSRLHACCLGLPSWHKYSPENEEYDIISIKGCNFYEQQYRLAVKAKSLRSKSSRLRLENCRKGMGITWGGWSLKVLRETSREAKTSA